MDIDNVVTLKARNNSEDLELCLGSQPEYGKEFWVTLTGTYEGKRIQHDFDTLTEDQLDELILGLQLLKEHEVNT